jgi:hypothetical protein
MWRIGSRTGQEILSIFEKSLNLRIFF